MIRPGSKPIGPVAKRMAAIRVKHRIHARWQWWHTNFAGKRREIQYAITPRRFHVIQRKEMLGLTVGIAQSTITFIDFTGRAFQPAFLVVGSQRRTPSFGPRPDDGFSGFCGRVFENDPAQNRPARDDRGYLDHRCPTETLENSV